MKRPELLKPGLAEAFRTFNPYPNHSFETWFDSTFAIALICQKRQPVFGNFGVEGLTVREIAAGKHVGPSPRRHDFFDIINDIYIYILSIGGCGQPHSPHLSFRGSNSRQIWHQITHRLCIPVRSCYIISKCSMYSIFTYMTEWFMG